MNTGETRLREDRHYSAAAQLYEGQACAADHGTHVASLAAGFESGAGKGASIVSGMQLHPSTNTSFTHDFEAVLTRVCQCSGCAARLWRARICV